MITQKVTEMYLSNDPEMSELAKTIFLEAIKLEYVEIEDGDGKQRILQMPVGLTPGSLMKYLLFNLYL